MGCTSFRDPSASFLFFDIFFGTRSTISDNLSTPSHTNLLRLRSNLRSSFPFSLPRSFLSFLGFLSCVSSPAKTDDVRLWAADRLEAPAGPDVNAADGTGGRVLELGVGSKSPSERDWYCNNDFSKNLEMKFKFF